jgi:predicted aldo/keto reductase-like oxidoreductase
VRYVGFTGHKSPELHLEMLGYDYDWDSCQLPLNCFDGIFRSFERNVLPELNRRGIAPIGMKSMGGDGRAVKARVVSAQDALKYALSLPVATVVSGIDSMRVLKQNLAVARGFTPLPASAMQAIRKRVAEQAVHGRFELYKISAAFEGEETRRVHGLPPQSEMPV